MGYRTVAERGTARFEIRRSRFIGHVEPVADVSAAEEVIEAVRADHPEATHVVPAYRVRADPLREWASDDGEPSGSAGSPALTVLTREALENVVAVVVRYYGGTNLGVGGLARAYARGVKDAIEATEVIERRPHERITVIVAYDDSGTVRGILESAAVAFEATYETDVRFEVSVPTDEAPDLRDRLRTATSGRVTIE